MFEGNATWGPSRSDPIEDIRTAMKEAYERYDRTSISVPVWVSKCPECGKTCVENRAICADDHSEMFRTMIWIQD